MPAPAPSPLERALLDAENRDPDALRALLTPAPVWHTPTHNLLGGDHMGQEQVIHYLQESRELTHGTLHVDETRPARRQGDDLLLTLHTHASRNGLTYDGDTTLRIRLENGRIAELWTQPENTDAWNRFWSP